MFMVDGWMAFFSYRSQTFRFKQNRSIGNYLFLFCGCSSVTLWVCCKGNRTVEVWLIRALQPLLLVLVSAWKEFTYEHNAYVQVTYRFPCIKFLYFKLTVQYY
jgi:hypothetical protein